MGYEFTVYSIEYGFDTYGSYASVEAALAGIQRIKDTAEKLDGNDEQVCGAVRGVSGETWRLTRAQIREIEGERIGAETISECIWY